MAKTYIGDLKAGQALTDFFALREKKVKEYNDKPYLVLELGDKTGRLSAVAWENFEQINQVVEKEDVVKVRGTVTTFRDTLQIKIDRIRKADRSEYELRDFLPETEKDRGKLLQSLRGKMETITSPSLKEAMSLCFDDPDLLERFCEAPAGKLWHHPYLGGLLEHTVAVATLCELAAEQYDLVDRDLLISGAILHDIGKIREYRWTTFIDYSDEGRLIGHVVIGDRMVSELMDRIEGFPEELRKKLSHLVLSHHGKKEYGSPVVPMTTEAIILYYADEMDAKMGAFERIIEREREPHKRWSSWVRLMERFIYFGEEGGGES